MRAVRIARSVGRPLAFEEAAGNLAGGVHRSSTSTVSGKKSAPSRASGRPCAVARTIVSPPLDEDGPVRLLGQVARLEDDLVAAHGRRDHGSGWCNCAHAASFVEEAKAEVGAAPQAGALPNFHQPPPGPGLLAAQAEVSISVIPSRSFLWR